MKELDTYNSAKKAVYDYFGFEEYFKVFEIDDRRNFWWFIDFTDVKYYDTLNDFETENGAHSYEDEIMTAYEKSIYAGKDFTAIIVDTNTDGNMFLAIYDNSKKINS